MQLPTYPRLNVKTKRFGIEADDIIWVGFSILPGFIVMAVVGPLGVIAPALFLIAAYCYYAFVKPKRPRGWVCGWYGFIQRPRQLTAEHEMKDELVRKCMGTERK